MPYNPDIDYGDSYSAQVARANVAQEIAKRAEKQAEREARYLQRSSRAARDVSPSVAQLASRPETDSSKTLVAQSALGPTQLDRARDKRAAKRAAARAEQTKAPEDTRTSAQKIADRFGYGQ